MSGWRPATARPGMRALPTGAEPLLPGAAHPHPHESPPLLALRLGVPAARVADWIARGLPCREGRVDPVDAANWLADGRLEQCPVLARRWRTWFAWFAPAVAGRDRACRLRVRRRCALHLPQAVEAVRWWIPRLGDGPGQRLLAASAPTGSQELPFHHRLDLGAGSGPWEVETGAELALTPQRPDDHPDLLALVEELAAGFRYGYRHHRAAGPFFDDHGSCLDCALALGGRLGERGRPWRLVGGVVARSAVANLHCWVEAEGPGGAWIALDPTLPAVARVLGPPGTDWRAWARFATGGVDTRRIRLGAGDLAPAGVAGGASFGGVIGEASALVEGVWRNAWSCLDLACGDCRWAFSRR